MKSFPALLRAVLGASAIVLPSFASAAAPTVVRINTPKAAPAWATLERRLLAETVPACREFAAKYYDERGYFRVFPRWGANDGPDDAFENFVGWPELHALGADDAIIETCLKTWNGMIRQYGEIRTVDVPAGRDGILFKEFSAQSDWMHHGEGLRTFNLLGLSRPNLSIYQERARRFAGFYMGEDPAVPNYDSQHKLIRSLINGSKGPLLREATALDWVGDPFDASGFEALHGEHTYAQFLAHYQEYGKVAGDGFLNLVATTLPLDAYLLANEAKYKQWVIDYMDAWLDRMQRNGGIIPSHVALDGVIGGPDGKWWESAYGWGFSPVNPVNNKRENRNRIPRAIVGFNNALLVTGDQKYVNAWRDMIAAINSHARDTKDGREYPSMYGANGWYGWTRTPWNVGALEIWYWSMRPDDRPNLGQNPWVSFLEGGAPGYPENVLQRDLDEVAKRLDRIRHDTRPAEKRLADNVMDLNPAIANGLVQLMWGALPAGGAGGLMNARVRYFDPVHRRAGIPADVAALVSGLTDTTTLLTLVNLNPAEPRTVIVQGGAYGEHQLTSVEVGKQITPLSARDFTVELAPGSGATLSLTMKRYANAPTVKFPWARE